MRRSGVRFPSWAPYEFHLRNSSINTYPILAIRNVLQLKETVVLKLGKFEKLAQQSDWGNMRITVVMPAYEESRGIESFVTEINQSLSEWKLAFVVIDDCSGDNTGEIAMSLNNNNIEVTVVRNQINLGHGPSTIKALQHGIQSGAEIIVAVDGDGQFLGEDIKQAINVLLQNSLEVVEGARIFRADPLYRKMISFVTRELVARKSGIRPRDANTPLRVYQLGALRDILSEIPVDSLTPNLLISVLVRNTSRSFSELPVRSIPRRGPNSTGITWGKTPRQMPSLRFIRFCLRAGRQWFRLK